MRTSTNRLAFAAILAVVVVTPALTGGLDRYAPLVPPQPVVVEHEFKLKGGGQVDFDAGTLSLAGQATHVGRVTFEGTLVPGTDEYSGTMFGQNGETCNADVTFVELASGEFALALYFSTMSTHTSFVRGEGAGTVQLDEDDMFAVEIHGTLFTCGGRRCLD